jgi:hypothetical protein
MNNDWQWFFAEFEGGKSTFIGLVVRQGRNQNFQWNDERMVVPEVSPATFWLQKNPSEKDVFDFSRADALEKLKELGWKNVKPVYSDADYQKKVLDGVHG